MKTNILVLVLVICFFPFFSAAGDVTLSQDLDAQAAIIKSDFRDKWEKTLVIRFSQRRRVISTNEGMADVLVVINHAAHPELWSYVSETMKDNHEAGGKLYMKMIHERIARQLGLRSNDISMMGTAADMDNLAVVTKAYEPFIVTAVVTAGAKGNAIRTGVDEGAYIESEAFTKGPRSAEDHKIGTINIIVLTNARITDGGLARAIITATEAKTAALEDLHVPSTYTKDIQATGTGTDTVIVASGTGKPLVTYPGGHSKIGELMGKAVYEAVVEALGKQNGFKRDK